MCPYCGRIMLKQTMQVDHIVSINLANKHKAYRKLIPNGDINNIRNLTASCPQCNNRKSDKGGSWILLARIGVPLYLIVWTLLITFAVWFFFRAAMGAIPRGFLVPIIRAFGKTFALKIANIITSTVKPYSIS